MAKKLETSHPLLMVPFVYSFSVVVYSNQSAPTFEVNVMRDALIGQLPNDCGVSTMTCTCHGVHREESRAIPAED